MVILYGIFSSVSYSVNVYLALRVVYPRATWLGFVVRLSLWTYVIVCACNWTTQLLWVWRLIVSAELSDKKSSSIIMDD